MRQLLTGIAMVIAAAAGAAGAQELDMGGGQKVKVPTWQEWLRAFEAERRNAPKPNWVGPRKPSGNTTLVDVTQTPDGSSAVVYINDKSWRFDTSQPHIRVDVRDNKVAANDNPMRKRGPVEELTNGITKQILQGAINRNKQAGRPGQAVLQQALKILNEPPRDTVSVHAAGSDFGGRTMVRVRSERKIQTKPRAQRNTSTASDADEPNAAEEEFIIGPRRLPIEEE